MLDLLRDLQAKYDTAIIFITHDLGVIAQMASYVVVMYLGRVMEQGPVDDIFHAPKHPYTRALLRSIPSLHGETARRPAGHQRLPPAPVQPAAGLPVPSALSGGHAERCDRAACPASSRSDDQRSSRAASSTITTRRREPA